MTFFAAYSKDAEERTVTECACTKRLLMPVTACMHVIVAPAPTEAEGFDLKIIS